MKKSNQSPTPESKDSTDVLSIFSEATLSSQLYDQNYLLVSVYSSGKIIIEGPSYTGKLIKLEFEDPDPKQQKGSVIINMDELIARTAFYEGDTQQLHSFSQGEYGKDIDHAITLVNSYTYGPYIDYGTYQKIAYTEGFIRFLNMYKKNQLEDAKPTRREVMKQHDKKHGCIEAATIEELKPNWGFKCSLM
jgi:hypothetical protein